MHKLKWRIQSTIARVLSRILPSSLMQSKRFFHLWETKGYHVTPVHFYEPVPDSRDFAPDIFERESALTGIEMNQDEQISLLNEFCFDYKQEYCNFGYGSSESIEDFYFENEQFETVDAEILYCMVRHFKPKNIIEIGSGFSTRITAAAIRQNSAENSYYTCNFVCVEPYRKDLIDKIPEVTKIIPSRVESLPIDTFKILDENDILFIDSSHIINVYNDVCFEYLDVFPILNKGVLVHVHDIVLPQQYCEYWYDAKFFWNEQYLLQAFLSFNKSFKILWAGNLMHLKHSNRLANAFPSYLRFKNSSDSRRQKQGHKSFWIQRVK